MANRKTFVDTLDFISEKARSIPSHKNILSCQRCPAVAIQKPAGLSQEVKSEQTTDEVQTKKVFICHYSKRKVRCTGEDNPGFFSLHSIWLPAIWQYPFTLNFWDRKFFRKGLFQANKTPLALVQSPNALKRGLVLDTLSKHSPRTHTPSLTYSYSNTEESRPGKVGNPRTERASKLLQGWLLLPGRRTPHTLCLIFFRKRRRLLLLAALSYLSTYCLFRSLCSTPSCPGAGSSCALQWGRPGFKPAFSPGLWGPTAP